MITTERVCHTCGGPLDRLTLALLGKQATHCTACENTWLIKTSPRPGGFEVWEETPSGKKQHQRLWWQYHRACNKGLGHKQDQCYLCHEYMERAAQGILHASGAVRIPKPGKAWLIWFPNCQRCAGGFMYIHSPYSMNGGSYPEQCPHCLARYVQWLQQHALIRCALSRPKHPIRLKIDQSKSLAKSRGRIFYHEIDYSEKERGSVNVEVYTVHPDTNERETLHVDGQYMHYFSSLADAQAWIFTQMGGSLRSFWL